MDRIECRGATSPVDVTADSDSEEVEVKPKLSMGDCKR